MLAACAGSPPAARAEPSAPLQSSPSERVDEPLDSVVERPPVEDTQQKPAQSDRREGPTEDEPFVNETKSSPPTPGQGTEHSWQDGGRTLTVILQPDLVVLDASSGAPATDVRAVNGDDVIVARSGAQGQDGLPVFKSASGDLMTLPGGVLLVLEPSWTQAEVDAFLGKNGIKPDRISELDYATNGFFVETEPGFPSLELANKLASQDGVIISSPNWWSDLKAQ